MIKSTLNYLKRNAMTILVVIALLLVQHAYLQKKNDRLLDATAKFGHFVGCLQVSQGIVPMCLAISRGTDFKKMVDIIKKDVKLQDQIQQNQKNLVAPESLKDI